MDDLLVSMGLVCEDLAERSPAKQLEKIPIIGMNWELSLQANKKELERYRSSELDVLRLTKKLQDEATPMKLKTKRGPRIKYEDNNTRRMESDIAKAEIYISFLYRLNINARNLHATTDHNQKGHGK